MIEAKTHVLKNTQYFHTVVEIPSCLVKHDEPSGLFIDTHQLDDLVIFSNYFSFVKASIIFNVTNYKIGI